MAIKKCMDTKFWDSVREDSAYSHLIKETVELYEKSNTGNLLSLTYNSRKKYYETGDRGAFEGEFFKRRQRLACATVLALLYPQKQEYIDEIHDLIWAICEEYSWVSPAHSNLSFERDLNIIDLFTAGVAALIAETCALLGDRLDEIVVKRAKEEAKRRVFDLYEKNDFSWKRGTNNWSPVCGGNVAIAMMYWEPELAEKYVDEFVSTMNSYLGGFYDDGACLEGLLYWGYGFGNFLWFAEEYKDFTNGRVDLTAIEKVKRIAMFAQSNCIKGNCTVSFADGRQLAKISVAMQYCLKKIYGDDIQIPPSDFMSVMPARPCWNYIIRSFAYFDKNMQASQNSVGIYEYPISHQYIANKEQYSFALKAGHNDEPHNHNDVGSFIISTDKGQNVIDIGAGRYTKEYFLPETRYEHFCTSSRGHSVPVINGQYQKAGKEYHGVLNINGDTVVARIEKAYGIENVDFVERKFVLGESDIVLTDTFCEGAEDVVERFVVSEKPVIDDEFCYSGDLKFEIPKECKKAVYTAETVEISDYNDVDGNKSTHTYYCLDFQLEKNVKSTTVKIYIEKTDE